MDISNFITEHALETEGPANAAEARKLIRDNLFHLPFRLDQADLLTLLHDLVYILATVALVFTFFVRIITVDGASMAPTLQEQDRLVLLSRLWYPQPQRGDVVVARIPDFSQEPIVKRIIAVEGDVVDIDFSSGTVSVNGMALEENYVSGPTHLDYREMGISFPVEIQKDCVFLLGDNRNQSYDSRFSPIGQVDQRNIVGKVVCLILPGSDAETQERDYDRVGKIG